MRFALVVGVLMLVGCSTTSATPSGPDPTDLRICQAAEQVPFQGPTIRALAASPRTPIQTQAAAVVDAMDNTGTGNVAVDKWNALTKMCVDAGM